MGIAVFSHKCAEAQRRVTVMGLQAPENQGFPAPWVSNRKTILHIDVHV